MKTAAVLLPLCQVVPVKAEFWEFCSCCCLPLLHDPACYIPQPWDSNLAKHFMMSFYLCHPVTPFLRLIVLCETFSGKTLIWGASATCHVRLVHTKKIPLSAAVEWCVTNIAVKPILLCWRREQWHVFGLDNLGKSNNSECKLRWNLDDRQPRAPSSQPPTICRKDRNEL